MMMEQHFSMLCNASTMSIAFWDYVVYVIDEITKITGRHRQNRMVRLWKMGQEANA